ncbi:phosphoribosylglycinamide formyltransferase [uncultured Oxalicibacterium sp.]|uniref:phosphoribosylglycinamide formyltransferase n=1 Tax=uncultured Oxalicibacterium sp. TaxID=1168540 RepID=UPI0025DD5032|nr:phosphoribosylglycinamide formyltransferase [uncultured Oxalicibacterium sp.]
MKRIVMLISGRGSNMQAILRAAADEQWPAEFAAVISNSADAPGLVIAAEMGVPTRVVPSADYPDRASFDAALQQAIDDFAPDLVVLAGFMRILTDAFVLHYQGRMLNIHPSLLPSFVGMATHRQALQAGVRVHGATVHFVTPKLDHGPIVSQVAVPVLPDDSEQSLAARVLDSEHRLYPQAVRWFIEERLTIVDGQVRIQLPVDAVPPQALFSP